MSAHRCVVNWNRDFGTIRSYISPDAWLLFAPSIGDRNVVRIDRPSVIFRALLTDHWAALEARVQGKRDSAGKAPHTPYLVIWQARTTKVPQKYDAEFSAPSRHYWTERASIACYWLAGSGPRLCKATRSDSLSRLLSASSRRKASASRWSYAAPAATASELSHCNSSGSKSSPPLCAP